MRNEKIRIVFADDHALFRSGIVELLKSNQDFEVVDEVDTGEKLIQSYFEHMPDIAIIDIAMPGISGYEAFEMIKARDKEVKALFLSMHTEEIYYYQIYSAGGMGLLGKNIQLGELEFALQRIMNGNVYFGKEYTEEILDELTAKYNVAGNSETIDGILLTQAQKDILKLVAHGSSSIEIADILNISKRTVDKQREMIKKKIKAETLWDIHKFAIKNFS